LVSVSALVEVPKIAKSDTKCARHAQHDIAFSRLHAKHGDRVLGGQSVGGFSLSSGKLASERFAGAGSVLERSLGLSSLSPLECERFAPLLIRHAVCCSALGFTRRIAHFCRQR